MRGTILSVITLFMSSVTKTKTHSCHRVFSDCQQSDVFWTKCYDDRIGSCTQSGRDLSMFYGQMEPSQEANVQIGNHRVQIPPSALKMSQPDQEYVRLVVTVLNSSYFELSPRPTESSTRKSGFVLDQSVLVVKAGIHQVSNLSQPVKLLFNLQESVPNGKCVFWKDSNVPEETGDWSTEGCTTSYNGTEYICSCNHLSFFAVLVNPEISVDGVTALNLNYISYIGSAISVVFTLVSLFMYIRLHCRRPEKAHGIHMQLAGAMLCLHLSFLASSLLFWNQATVDEALCSALGLVLHWSLLATFSWTALEGFHLYLLLVRVFNIYIRKYLLKISLFGWGFPTLVAMICGIAQVYGEYRVNITDANETSTGQICWINHTTVSYITTVAYPCLVILYNGCMLGMVVSQLWGLRRVDYVVESSRGWNKLQRERMRRLWKDSVTVLGLSCVLGLPWWLASATYVSVTGLYVFTVFNALQGFFMFLWCLALNSKSKSENNSSIRDQHTQKMTDSTL